MKNIVSREWLLENMETDNLVILDVRSDMNDPKYGELQYKMGHIRKAQFVSFKDVLVSEIKAHGGRHPLPEMKDFIEKMKDFGVDNDSIVVVYDDGNLEMAGRLWWMLKYAGKNKVYVLEGGVKGWKKNNFNLTTEIDTPNKSNALDLNINKSIAVDMEYVKSNLESENIAIIDSRAYERFIGEVEPLDKIPGHIPNALNYPWMNLLADEELYSPEELFEYFKELDGYEEIIVHCGSGITGTVNIIFMEEIGLKPKLYVGGYSDWISYDDNEIITK